MALSDHKINSFEKPVSALADKPQMSAAELKAWFDSNSTGEIKTSINGLIDELAEELGGKVDVSDGKGLSSNDYTDEDKAKVHTHANKAILDEITAAYTTAEKTKLSGIAEEANNYTHPSTHSADMIIETATKRFTSDTELSGKVDKVTGMGLSSNDYTDEDKTKLAAIDISKQHEHANKEILDAITSVPVTTVTMEQVDICDYSTRLARGVYVLPYDHVWDTSETYGDQMYYERDLLIVSDYYDGSEPCTKQTRIISDGKILFREINWIDVSNGIVTEWGDWIEVTHTHSNKSILDAITASYTTADKAKVHTHTNKSILDAITDTPLPDAPSDDIIYGRKNGDWSEIINGLPTVTMEQVDVYDYLNHLPRGIYALVHDYVWETDPDYGDQMYYERDLLIVSDYTYFDEPYTTQVRYTNMGQVMRRVASWNSTSTTEWGDWSAVTYTKYEIDTALNAKANKTTEKTVLTPPVTANTIYNLGKETALSITLPSGSIGDFIQLDFISGSTATTLTVNSSSGLAGFDLIPATDTVYSLYFDWGAIGYSGNTATYGWRFGYSEYPIEDV